MQYRPSPLIKHLLSVALVVFQIGAAVPARALDFNGDGVADLLFRDRTASDNRLGVVINGRGDLGVTARGSIVLSTASNRSRGFDVHTGDFDGDGRDDILTRDLLTGASRIRLMNGLNVRSTRTVTELPASLAVTLVAVADFNGDARDDLLYRDEGSGTWSVYLLNGVTPDLAHSGETAVWTGAGVRLVSAADFDGDGSADIVVRNANTLYWTYFRMSGRTVLRSARITGLPQPAEWQLQAVADFNLDSRADLLLRHNTTGAWWTAFMNGQLVLPESGAATMTTNRAFSVQRVADFNGDRYPDLLLQRRDNGRLAVNYLMQRWRLAESGLVDLPVDAGFRVADVADYNGDGAAEVLGSDNNASWSLVDLRDRAGATLKPLGVSGPRELALVCERPNYYQLGGVLKPADAGASSAFLKWIAPVTRENGEPLCGYELGGYQVNLFASGMRSVSSTRIVDPRVDSLLFDPLAPETYYFRILAYDTDGYFSSASNMLSKTIR